MRKAISRLFWTLVVACLAFMAFLWVFVLQDSPTVGAIGSPTPEDAVVARSFVRDVRAAGASTDGAAPPLVVTESDLNSLIRVGARVLPGMRGQIAVAPDAVRGAASVPVPYVGRWLNVAASAPSFTDAFRVEDVVIGGLSIPGGLAVELGRIAGNAVFGNGFGDTVLASASRMEISGGEVRFDLDIAEMGKNGVMRGFFGTLRGAEMPMDEQIDRYYVMIREAMDRGDLPTEGSYLPYLLFTLNAARSDSADTDPNNAYTAAIFALTRVCGARDFTAIVGGLAGTDIADDRAWRTNCEELTFNGRVDSRRHFTTAAALQAASNRGFAVSVGEFKELFDTLKSGGFDFTDIAANNSGIRLSNRLMSAPQAEWAGLIDRISGEADIIISFDGLPQIMSEDDFKARFGSVESAEYYAVLAEIEARIDRLPLHRLP